MTYQEWDFVADTYIPLLGVFFTVSMINVARNKDWMSLRQSITGVLLSTGFIYGLMWLDNIMNIWPRLGLDYSTHTALALVFVVYFSRQSTTKRLLATSSMLLYCLLMLYQQYHSIMDMLTTSIITLPILYLIQLRTSKTKNISGCNIK
ncbi:hypothetical protein [uncultured Shewanella sp.]|uniref:hypothetical protein n=1 Tax=uncultured Shewanella sp. TaxID=173975 RepID=UPI00260C426F|nr:hypothetical protein [uncultured Shewanella sp.]